jgi:hypothetical protein
VACADHQHVFGILVSMYAFDIAKHHAPHIHVRYNEYRIVLGIPDGEVLEGGLPSRQMKLVQAWIEIHRDELMADWTLAASGQTPYKIDPLR